MPRIDVIMIKQICSVSEKTRFKWFDETKRKTKNTNNAILLQEFDWNVLNQFSSLTFLDQNILALHSFFKVCRRKAKNCRNFSFCFCDCKSLTSLCHTEVTKSNDFANFPSFSKRLNDAVAGRVVCLNFKNSRGCWVWLLLWNQGLEKSIMS